MSMAPPASMEDLRFDPTTLRAYLLGEAHWSDAGLIARVTRRVHGFSSFSSITTLNTALSGSSSPTSQDDGVAENMTELVLALVEWRGPGIGQGNPAAKRMLLEQLRRHHITDVEFLFGPQDEKEGLLYQIRTEVRGILDAEYVSGKDRHRCFELADYLRSWLGPCDHDFSPEHSDRGIVLLRCIRCDARAGRDKRGRWIAV